MPEITFPCTCKDLKFHGVEFFVPEDEAILPAMKNGTYEIFELFHVSNYVREGDTVVDVGACIGVYSVILGRAMNGKGRVVAFEPEPTNARILEINGRRNNLDIEIVRKAAGAGMGKGSLSRSPNNAGDHSLHGESTDKIPVDVISLDQYLGDNRKVSIIKMDTQGMELHVIQGAQNTIRNNPKISLLVEFCPSALRKCGSTPEQLLSWIYGLGFFTFSFFPMSHSGSEKGMLVDYSQGYGMQFLSKQELLDMEGPQPDWFLNLWCVRSGFKGYM